MEMTSSSEREADYHSTDFDWEQLRQEIESLPSFSYHLSPHTTASSTSDSSLVEADSWRCFHRRHSTARFFKIFTLSAVPFGKMSSVIQKCASVLNPGGLILFRDCGVYDMTMLRFPPEQNLGFGEYIWSDGTLSYFFSSDVTRDLFCEDDEMEVSMPRAPSFHDQSAILSTTSASYSMKEKAIILIT